MEEDRSRIDDKSNSIDVFYQRTEIVDLKCNNSKMFGKDKNHKIES